MKNVFTILLFGLLTLVQTPVLATIRVNTDTVQTMSVTPSSASAQKVQLSWLDKRKVKLLQKRAQANETSGFWKGWLAFCCFFVGILLFILGVRTWVEDAGETDPELQTGVGPVVTLLGAALLLSGYGLVKSIHKNALIDNENYKNQMDTYLGKDEPYIIQTWGAFGKTASDGQGGKVLRFETVTTVPGISTYQDYCKCVTTTPPTRVVDFTEFYISDKGTVYKWKNGRVNQ